MAATPRQRDVDSFDGRARSYEHDWRSQFHAQVVAGSAEVALWAMPHPATVLDVGCGTGALLRTLVDRLPARVALAGVDPAPAMIEVGRAALGAYPRVDLFAIGWLRPLAALGRRRDRMPTAGELEAMLAAARLTPLAWRRVYDLGPLPLVRAVVAACS